MEKYYNIKHLINKVPDAKYYVVFGERSNGKTYSSLNHCLERYFSHGEEFAIVRRYREDLKGKNGASMFSSLIQNKVIEKLSKGAWNGLYYYSQRWYLLKTKRLPIGDRFFLLCFRMIFGQNSPNPKQAVQTTLPD